MRQYPFIYSQRDSSWADNQLGTVPGATIGAYGCILTCHAMKAGYYGHEIKPNALNDIYTQKNLYISGDLLSDADLSVVFPDIKLLESTNYVDIPADLSHIKQLAADPTLTITIEVDFDHNSNDGIQTHFVELHSFDGTTMTIYDPWYGTDDNFSLHYGTDLATTIQKIAVYQGTPTAAPVSVDAATFQKLVANSTSYDAVCDELGEPHNIAGSVILADIVKLKSDKAADEQSLINLNKQIPVLEGQVSTLKNQVTDLEQKLELAQKANVEPVSGISYQKLYEQANSDRDVCLKTGKNQQQLIDDLEKKLQATKPQGFWNKILFCFT